jgi:predicted MFS family arabinose efflux permease
LAILFEAALAFWKQRRAAGSRATETLSEKSGEAVSSPALGNHSSAGRELKIGWRVVLTSAVGCGLGYAALVFYTFGLFIDPIAGEFDWTRGEVSSIYSFGSFSVLLVGPPMGWIIDRIGFRRVALVCIPSFSAMLFVLSQMEGALWSFRLAFAVTGLVGLGTTPVVYTRIVNERFDAARGLALGLTLVGVGLAAILLPPAVANIIAAHGWRSAFALLSAIAMLPWFLVVGTKESVRRRPGSPGGVAPYWPALKSSVLWRLGLGFSAVALAVSAIIVHIVPMLKDMGVSPSNAAATASLMGFGVILGRVLTGWLLDRLFAPYLISGMLLLGAAGILCLAQGGPSFAVVAAMLMGFVLGAEVDLIAYLTARYFRIENYSFLFALLYTCFAIGAANGPVLLGRIFDYTGSYHLAMWVAAGLLVAAALLFTTFPDYESHRQRDVLKQPSEVSLVG